MESRSFKQLIFSAQLAAALRPSIPRIKQNREKQLSSEQEGPRGSSASRIGRAAEDNWAKSLRTMGNLPGVKDPWSAAGWSRTGLQHHESIVHLSQKLWVYAFSNVIDLVWVCSEVVDFYKHLQEMKRWRKEKSKGYYI